MPLFNNNFLVTSKRCLALNLLQDTEEKLIRVLRRIVNVIPNSAHIQI